MYRYIYMYIYKNIYIYLHIHKHIYVFCFASSTELLWARTVFRPLCRGAGSWFFGVCVLPANLQCGRQAGDVGWNAWRRSIRCRAWLPSFRVAVMQGRRLKKSKSMVRCYNPNMVAGIHRHRRMSARVQLFTKHDRHP